MIVSLFYVIIGDRMLGLFILCCNWRQYVMIVYFMLQLATLYYDSLFYVIIGVRML